MDLQKVYDRLKRKVINLNKLRPPKELAKGDYLEVRKMRWDLLIEKIRKNRYKSGLEIGAGYGLTAFMVLANTRIEHWKVLDPFITYEGYIDRMNESSKIHEMRENTYELLSPFLKEGRCEIIEERSEVYIPEGIVDIIFIDGNHTYEHVKKDIEKYHPYAQEFLGGHDISREDTSQAVYEKARELGVKVKTPGIDDVWYFTK